MRNDHLKKVSLHPNKEEIIEKLVNGESIREIVKWLDAKYGKSPKLHHLKVSLPTLQAFRKEVLKLDGQVLKDLQEQRKKQDAELEAGVIKQAVTSTNAYRDRLNKIADKHLDVATKIIQLDAVIGDRIEHWYNLIKSGEGLPDKSDYELRKYIDQQMVILRDWKKLVEGMADKRVDYNVNITVMNEQIQTIQTVIRDLICEEMGPEKAIEFLEKLSNRLSTGQENKALSGKVVDVTHESE